MKSLASLSIALLALAAPAKAQEPPPGDGPRGSSQLAPGELRFDEVGYAAQGAGTGYGVASPGLSGEVAEVTALDSGKSVLVLIAAGDGTRLAISARVLADLGITAGAAVRVRRVVATPQDIAMLRSGQAASTRIGAPPALLAALRRKLAPSITEAAAGPVRATAQPVVSAPPSRSRPKVAATPMLGPKPDAFAIQIGSFASRERADALAGRVGGVVSRAGNLYRVRIGPLPDRASAERARAAAASQGHSGATVVRFE